VSKQGWFRIKTRPLGPTDPSGTPVAVLRDDMKTVWTTKTRSDMWRLPTGDMVVMLDGMAGCFLASRCSVLEVA
jgi:hypothetical protein